MIRIIDYAKRENQEGEQFFVLVLQSGIQMVRSKETGRFYATARKATISSTFDEVTCQSLIGTQYPGRIVKQECEPYSFTIPETNEEIQLSHRWVYEEGEESLVQENELVDVAAVI